MPRDVLDPVLEEEGLGGLVDGYLDKPNCCDPDKGNGDHPTQQVVCEYGAHVIALSIRSSKKSPRLPPARKLQRASRAAAFSAEPLGARVRKRLHLDLVVYHF